MNDNGTALIEAEDEDQTGTEVPAQLPDPSWGCIQAAKTYPRSIQKFAAAAEAMATLNQEIAAQCMYTLPRGGKQITGPSVRLAEICASAWGNLDFGARIAREEATFVVAQGFAHDLQTNTRCAFEIRRRIMDSKGRRYNDDMITMTVNAAQSIALRNAIFRVIPKALVQVIYDKARAVAVGDQKTLGDRRRAMVEHFTKLGVTVDRILAGVRKPSVEDMDGEDLLALRGLANAIKDEAVSIDAAFPENTAAEASRKVGAIKAKPNGDNRPEAPPQQKPTDQPTPFQLHAKAIEEAESAGEVDAAYADMFDDNRLSKGEKMRLSSAADERRKQLTEAANFGKSDEQARHDATK